MKENENIPELRHQMSICAVKPHSPEYLSFTITEKCYDRADKYQRMNELIDNLTSLSKQPRLIPAEEIITSKLADFDSILPASLSPAEIEQCEKALLSLLSINNGHLSLPCSVRISLCLLKVYSFNSPPKLWNIFTLVSSKPTPAGMFAIGYVIKKIGEHSKSMIPGLVKVIVNQNEIFPALFVLNPCLRKSSQDLKMYFDKIYAICRKALLAKEETSQLYSIKTMMTMLTVDAYPQKKWIQTAQEILKGSYTLFVIDETCQFVAKMAFLPLKAEQNKKKQTKDFVIGSKSQEADPKLFDQTFLILETFQSHFPTIFRHFLNFLTPQFIYDNLRSLFSFVRKTNPAELSQLLSLFGRYIKSELFREIAAEQPPSVLQHQILRSLSYDDSTTSEIAALSLQLTQSDSPSARLSGASFFAVLAESHPKYADHYLTMSLLYLASPPEGNPTIERDIQGMALIATHILGASPSRLSMVQTHKANIQMFLNRAYNETNIYGSYYMSLYLILSVLPPEYVDQEKINTSLQIYVKEFQRQVSNNETNNQIKLLTRYVLSFLSSHPHVTLAGTIINLLGQVPSYQTLTTDLCSMFAAAGNDNIDIKGKEFYMTKILTGQPNQLYLQSKIKYPMLSEEQILIDTQFVKPGIDLIYFKVTPMYYTFRAIEFFPHLVLGLSEESFINVFTQLIDNTTNRLMCHALLLSLVSNPATQILLPSNFHSLLLPMIKDGIDGTLRLQLTAECLARWADIHPNAMNDILTYVQPLKSIGQCLVYCSLFAFVDMSVNTVMVIVQELNALAKIQSTCAFALFALGTLFNSYSTGSSALSVADIECQVLLSLIHTSSLLNPYNFYFMSHMFVNLLAVLSPEIMKTLAGPLVKLIILAFNEIPIPFSHGVMYNAMRAVFAFTRDFADPGQMRFPRAEGTTVTLQVAASGAFSDMLKVRDAKANYFNLVPQLLILLQKTGDSRVSDFLYLIAVNSISSVQQVAHWVKIIKSILTNASLPDLQIESSMALRCICSQISSVLLKPIAESNPFMNECLDDLMTSSARAIETSDLVVMKNSYKFLCQVLELFKDTNSGNGLPMLELYDSQFSIAVRHGFQIDLSLSGEFLLNYFAYHRHNLLKRPLDFKTVLNGYTEGLDSCKQRNDYFYSLAAHLFCVAYKNEVVYEYVQNLGAKLVKDFGNVVKECIRLLEVDPPNHVSISQIRAKKSNYFNELLISYVWLHSKFEPPTDDSALIEFFVHEIETCTESWRRIASLNSLTVALQYLPVDTIKLSTIEKAVSVVVKIHEQTPQLLSGSLPSFLRNVSKRNLVRGSPVWESVLDLMLNASFDCVTVAHLIGNHPVEAHSSEVVEKVFSSCKNDEKTMALLTILLDVAWQKELSLIFNSKFDFHFKIKLLQRLLKKAKNVDGFEEKISEFFFIVFKKGGMNALAQVILNNPEVATKILNWDSCRHFCDICSKDIQNIPVFLQFINLAYNKCELSEESMKDVCQCILKAIVDYGKDVQKGREITECGIRIILAAQQKYGFMKELFLELTEREQQMLIIFIENNVQKASKKKNVALKQFSTSRKRITNDSSEDEEWQTLEIE